MSIRRPWRVLLWSLALYVVLVALIAALEGCDHLRVGVGCDAVIAAVAVPLAVPSVWVWAADRVLTHFGVWLKGYHDGETSVVEHALDLLLAGLFLAEFVAQTMAAASIIDRVVLRFARSRSGEQTGTGEPTPPRA